MRTMIWIAILLIGCETKEHANAELDALAKARKAAAKASAHANTGEAEEIGVPECDQYIRRYEDCLMQKVPPTRQADLRATLDDEKRRWHAAMIDGASKETLAQQCRSAASLARTKMSDYGCEF
jgi:HPt (histidine-containing phosphotransfer) domain-containing protein